MALPPSPNFAFLAYHDTRLVALATLAEHYFADDPNTCLFKLRQFGELLAQRAAARLGLYTGPQESQLELLNRLAERGAFDALTKRLFHDLRVTGNQAVHALQGDHHTALYHLKIARELALWFQRSFGNNKKFDPGPFVPPPSEAKHDLSLSQELQRLRDELQKSKIDVQAALAAAQEEAQRRISAEERAQKEAEDRAIWEALAQDSEEQKAKHIEALELQKTKLETELAAIQHDANALPPKELARAFQRAAEAARAIHLDEASTRRIIDEQLRELGWIVDTENLRYERGTRPEKGKNIAIAEWPTEKGIADYVLFVGTKAMAVVEAKRKRTDVAGAIEQAKRYSRGFREAHGAMFAGGPWGKDKPYKVPFLFATNGRPYLQQIAEKSGIWFRDARREQNHARPLSGWYSPEGLSALFAQDIEKAHEKLHAEPIDALELRDYQRRAIEAVEKAIEAGRSACLVAMATGTGKTRTAIGLVYRLLKSRRFRRVLFLVDRSALGEQTENALEEVKLENLQTMAQIFDIKGLEDIKPERDTRLHVATVQGMVKRILYPSQAGDTPPVDQYDCLVVDECHRGYGLDREMSDTELGFRDLSDYISKYRRVLDHFDAVKIGLTATPALHTTQIFGEPTYQYSYREAVIDGYLIDHEPPLRIMTELGEKGIHFGKGEQVELFDPGTQKLDLVHLEDEVDIDIDGFNQRVITRNFNRVVLEELARHIDPMAEGKTLIFAANDSHADMVVDLFKHALDAQYGGVDDDLVVKITGASDQPLKLIRRFKNERLPKVAVTVDLLTTGVDVPAISTLVFLRRVKSRILYEQMLGRATRLCAAIGKSVFRIFDAVDLYAALEKYSSMKPVVAAPDISFQKLVAELGSVADAEARRVVLEQLIAKLQRRRFGLGSEELTRFEGIAGMSPKELARSLKEQSPDEALSWLSKHAYVIAVLDQVASERRPVLISAHEDKLVGTEHGYGKAKRPEDYLEGFRAFLRENMNKIPALVVVTQRPRDLTRKALRELQLALDGAGYTELGLQTAWRQMSNAEIAASIIGHIRQATLGDPLVPYEERVDRALQKILSARSYTTPQREWLKRIGLQIKKETVVDREALDGGAFKSHGGFKHLNRVFEGKLEELLGELSEEIWKNAG